MIDIDHGASPDAHVASPPFDTADQGLVPWSLCFSRGA